MSNKIFMWIFICKYTCKILQCVFEIYNYLEYLYKICFTNNTLHAIIIFFKVLIMLVLLYIQFSYIFQVTNVGQLFYYAL